MFDDKKYTCQKGLTFNPKDLNCSYTEKAKVLK